LPQWLAHGLNEEAIPLSYAFLNIALVSFDRRSSKSIWLSIAPLLAALPFFLVWLNRPDQMYSDALVDLLVALECIVATALLFSSQEHATQVPRLLMGWFMVPYVFIELARVCVTFLWHGNPDITPSWLMITSAVAYIANLSLLPLAFVWMMQARLEWNLLQQSMRDPLTGMLNRRGYEEAVERELVRYRRYKEEFTLAMLDLDRFKRVNDRYGHPAGDAVLAKTARFLACQLRESDIICRLGGEEFVLLMPQTDIAQAASSLNRLRSAFHAEGKFLPSTDLCITFSIGVTGPAGRTTIKAATLLGEADQALYRAKEEGRDRVCVFYPSAQ
jgi:diguanylate cyclase (GGDEF)-like protein